MKHKPLTFEYSQITKYIYIGTNMCCQTHFDKSLIKKEIRADISLEEKTLDQRHLVLTTIYGCQQKIICRQL